MSHLQDGNRHPYRNDTMSFEMGPQSQGQQQQSQPQQQEEQQEQQHKNQVHQSAPAPPPSLVSRFYHSFDEYTPTLDADGLPIPELKKRLGAYHSQLITLGGTIGTGLFVASGGGLAVSGPLPLLGAFAFVGFALCPTIFALGEMATLISKPGGFFEHCRMYAGEAWGGAMGWNYVFQWLLTLPVELVAASITLQVWGKPLPYSFIWVFLFLFLLLIINLFGVRAYGNAEALFSIIKITGIISFIIFGILYDLGLGLGFHGKAIGVSNWYQTGAAHNGFYGFCSVLVTAAFAYSGSEVVGLTANEQENPKRDMPRAIKQVFWRIGIFYMLSILLIGLLVPYNNAGLIQDLGSLSAAASPFVIAIKNSEVKVLPTLMNVTILVAIFSVANSSVYGSSRVLHAMAKSGLAPKGFAYVDKMGRPLRCLYVSFIFGLLALLTEVKQNSAVFLWLLSLCGLSSVISWASICWTHIRFRKALKLKNKALSTLPYESPLGVMGSWIGLLCNIFIILCQVISGIHPPGSERKQMSPTQYARNLIQTLISLLLVVLVWTGFKWFKGTEMKGITMSWSGIKLDNPRVVWGPGAERIDLAKDDSFKDSWDDGSYVLYAKKYPHLVVKVERLWWCPPLLRVCITFFDFPWRLRGESDLVRQEEAKKEMVKIKRIGEEHTQEMEIREEEFWTRFNIETERARERWERRGREHIR